MLADPEVGTLEDIVDTTNYPLHDDTRIDELGRWMHGELARAGAITLASFLRASALDTIAEELHRAREHVTIRRHRGTVYARTALEASLPANDPRRVELEWAAGHVTRDMIPCYSAAQRLYVSPEFKRLIARAVGQPRVFEYADPIAGLVATVLPPGGMYPWHYDTNEFVVTIMIQRAETGGTFVFSKDLRKPGDENLDGLRNVLSGADKNLTVTNNAPGDLQLFLGRYSLHQVTPVEGADERLVLVLSYADRPGVIGPLDRTRKVYGRVTEAHLVAAEQAVDGADGLIL